MINNDYTSVSAKEGISFSSPVSVPEYPRSLVPGGDGDDEVCGLICMSCNVRCTKSL